MALSCTARGRMFVVVGALALVLPLVPRFALGTDFAEHVVLLEVLSRIVRGDAATQQIFAVSLQPLNYHLFYLCGTILSLVLGAALACRALLLLSGIALLVRTYRRLLPTRASALIMPVAVIYLSELFRWGFVPNVVAMGLAGIVLLELSDENEPPVWRPPLIAVAAVATHIMAYPAVMVAAAAAWLCRLPTAPAAVYVMLASSLTTLPGLVWASIVERSGPARHKSYDFAQLRDVPYALYNFVTDGDSLLVSLGGAGLAALLAILALSAWPRAPGLPWGRHRQTWMLALTAAGCLTLLRICPSSSPGAMTTAVQLEWRCLPLGQLALLLLAARSAVWERFYPAVLIACLCALVTIAHSAGLAGIGLALERQTLPWPDVPLPPNARIAIVQQEMQLQAATPPRLPAQDDALPAWQQLLSRPYPRTRAPLQRVHAMLWALVDGGALWADEQFAGNHVPVALRDPDLFVRSHAMARSLTRAVTWRAYLAAPQVFDDDAFAAAMPQPQAHVPSDLWRTFDVVWWESPHIELLVEHLGEDARVLARGWSWVALGAKK